MYKWYEGLDPKNVLYAVNCGSDDTITDVGGIEYLSDRGFSGGQPSKDGYQQKKWIVPNTEVYYSERWNDANFNYKIPINTSKDNVVTLILKFSEIYFLGTGNKVFDVKLGDLTLAKDLDPYKLAYGKYAPYDLFAELVIRSGKLFYEGKEVKGAIRSENDGKYLLVDFIKGRADNPKVNAILLVSGGARNTH